MTPQTFISAIAMSIMKVADDTEREEGQYCVNFDAEIVRVTMLIQLASLDGLSKSYVTYQVTYQYVTPTAQPSASTTKTEGKS